MYEGVPNFPANDRLWAIIEKYKVTKFYTAPTAIRTFMKWGATEPEKHDLSSLRLLGSVGEPINPEAWMWYHEHIGGGTCPVVDTWWQTETGGIMISPLPGATTTKPGSATFALPGIGIEVVDDTGKTVDHGGGYLTLTHPWPGMLRGIWGDAQRYFDTYWSRYEGRYFAGDGCKLTMTIWSRSGTGSARNGSSMNRLAAAWRRLPDSTQTAAAGRLLVRDDNRALGVGLSRGERTSGRSLAVGHIGPGFGSCGLRIRRVRASFGRITFGVRFHCLGMGRIGFGLRFRRVEISSGPCFMHPSRRRKVSYYRCGWGRIRPVKGFWP
jgi:acyl-CoA synthetase (AMP-forming)/AMP-acid ligase II